ncbi:hypothetical protein GGI25_000913 [Coemansia spiralis]|uniref:Mitochondrial carrier protein n=2 Tax=Coemansia TaxID=4863 RepID=A0A9W8GAP8_9FUNG|nr:hypothetical protein EDC05_001931 [Coemansia umbellata]KAJ2623147.1 hypothetical protein GGI26_002561 [Coemansia sp. RSA 1358]KAJ2680025.1 hypothetical protein GGI25_000913 [Coemansia spiralis]
MGHRDRMPANKQGSLVEDTALAIGQARQNDNSIQPGIERWRLALYENRTLASAITAAVTGMLVGYPFDSLKTRMQTHQYQSLLACARRSISEEGVAGLYRGLLPPLLTASTAKSMSFSVFEQTKQWLRQHDPYRDKAPPFGITDFQRKTTGSIALTAGLAGSISGAVIAAICCPLELVKVQMQLARLMNRPSSLQSISAKLNTTQNKTPTEKVMHCGHRASSITAAPSAALSASSASSSSAGTATTKTAPAWAKSNLSVLREIIRQKGLLGMYYGIGLHVVRDSSGTAIYFAAYETVKETLRRITGSETTGPMTHMLAGGTCGVVSWLLIFPVDLVKSTIQSQVLKPSDTQEFKSSWQCMRSIYSRLGLVGLYRGVSVSLIRAFPIHGLNFVVYEWARSTICWLAAQRPE